MQQLKVLIFGFSDEQYKDMGLNVSSDLSNCEVMIGVKEVPVNALIPNKSIFSLVIPLKNSLIIEHYYKPFLERI